MIKTLSKILFFILTSTLIFSCNVTKKIPEGYFYLKSNEYDFEDESPFSAQLDNYVSQKPNKRILGVLPFKDWAYNQVPIAYDSVFLEYYSFNRQERNQALLDSLWLKYGMEDQVGENKLIPRLLYKAGAKPVTLDTTDAEKSASQLKAFYFERGYFDAEVNPTYDIDSTAQKAQVTYNIDVNEPSILVDYNQVIMDSKLEELYAQNRENNKIKIGQRFDVRNFEKERERLSQIFLNNGYFKFNDLGNELIFKIDSTVSKDLGATLKIAKPSNDSIQNFQQYYFGDVNVYVDYRDEQSKKDYDTLHMGYNLYSYKPFKLRPRVYTDAITIRSGDLYNLTDVATTRRLILDRDNYSLSTLRIEKQDPENPLDSILVTNILLQPKDKYDLEISFEGMYSQFINFGISPGLRLLTRNVFHGGENLEFNLRGTVGTVNNGVTENKFFNAFEISFETIMTFPRWVLPFNTEGLVKKAWNPKSSISLGLSGQRNIGLGSRTYSSIIDYSWEPHMNTHRFELLNFQYIRNTEKQKYYRIFTVDNEIKEEAFAAYFDYSPDVEDLYVNGNIAESQLERLIYNDEYFANQLPIGNYSFIDYTDFRNVIFRKKSITQDVLIQSFSHTYTYNENLNPDIRHPWSLSAKAEVASPILRLLDKTFSFDKTSGFFGEETSLIGGVPYSEFAKIDLDVRKTFQITDNTQIALRSFTGIAIPYGNLGVLPFSKSYFGGGSNDVRAWQAYELSPAPLRIDDGGTYIDQLKITWNAEYRFPISGMFHGAAFVDAGNIWSITEENSKTKFKFDTFLSELGIGAGFGLRFDFSFVVARLDFAYKIHNPAYPSGDRWFKGIKVLQPQWQFGVNYPF